MITFVQGDILQDEEAEALVNPVNCVGVMGKGLALEFRKRFPDNYTEYRRACQSGRVRPGQMMVFKTYRTGPQGYIINFPTKRDWREASRLEDIQEGLKALAQEIRNRRIQSIAIPALGSGLGGLQWKEVRKAIVAGLEDLEEVHIKVYQPVPARRKAR